MSISSIVENPAISSFATPMNFNIDYLDQSCNPLTSVTVLTETDIIPAHDATAVIRLKVSDMWNTFRYQTDSINMNDINGSDLRYYVNLSNWNPGVVINPAHAMMDDALSQGGLDINNINIPSNKKLLKHDYIRYLALKLFNTTQGVDLMSNVLDLNENMASVCGDFSGSIFNNIISLLKSISTTGNDSNLTFDNSGNYLTNSLETNKNIVRSLMNQILYYNPARFQDISGSSSVFGTSGIFGDLTTRPVPLMVGDVLFFVVNVTPPPGQNVLTNVQTIPSRTYLIKLVLCSDSTAINTPVIDSALVGDQPYSSYPITLVDASDSIFGQYDLPLLDNSYNNLYGWRYVNKSAYGAINWTFKPSKPITISKLNNVYMTLKINNKTKLPYLNIMIKDASNITHILKYSCTNNNVITNNFNCQFCADISSNPVNIDGYQNIVLSFSNSGYSYTGTETVSSINVVSDPNVISSYDFVLNSLVINGSDASNNPLNSVLYFQPGPTGPTGATGLFYGPTY